MKKFLYRLRGYLLRLFEKDETERLILGSIASKAQAFLENEKPSPKAGFCFSKVIISPSPQQQSHSLPRLLG